MIVAPLAKGNSPDASAALLDIRSHQGSNSGRDSATELPFDRINMGQAFD
jgi:hypothetical protein